MWRRLATAGRSRPGTACSRPRALLDAPRQLSVASLIGGGARDRAAPGSRRGVATQLGTYLERAGAVWGEPVDVQEVRSNSEKDGSHSWSIDLPQDRLALLRRGDLLESPPFSLAGNSKGRARFQFFPKGDANCKADGMCSLWLWSDESAGPLKLRVGNAEHTSGSSEFCLLEDVMRDGKVDVSLDLQAASVSQPNSESTVQQSLHVTGMQLAEWRIFQMNQLREHGDFVNSPPFRFHHVLLGDMYLEVLFGAPHPGFCTVFFRCRVPTMQLKVKIDVGSSFSKSFVSLGKNTPEEDMKTSSCLQVNLDAPGVLSPEGDLIVRCSLEEVVSLPATLRDMIPRLDERAQWPKRL